MVACERKESAGTLAGDLFDGGRDAGRFAAAVVSIIFNQAICLPIRHVQTPECLAKCPVSGTSFTRT